MESGFAERWEIAGQLRARRSRIAAAVATRIFDLHPEWPDRDGELARSRGRETIGAQIDYLAGAVVAGRVAAFEEYARWAARVLSARGVPRTFLADTLTILREEASRDLTGAPASVVDRMVRSGLTALQAGPNGGPERPTHDDPSFRVERTFYLEALRSGERDTALDVALDAVGSGASVLDVYREILEPAQIEIGRLWERNEITVAREHAATAITGHVMDRLHAHLDVPTPRRGRALVTGVGEELHRLDAKMVAYALEAAGWDLRLLGTPLPAEEVLDATEEHDPSLIGISTTILFNLPDTVELVRGIRRRLGPAPRILVGGAAFRSSPGLWREVGADGYGRDLKEAVQRAAELS